MDPSENAILKARRRDDTAQRAAAQTRSVLRQAVNSGCAAGMTEQRAADLAGVNRLTVREWLGKPKAGKVRDAPPA